MSRNKNPKRIDYKKRLLGCKSRYNRLADSIINNLLVGSSNEELLGMFEQIVQTQQYKEKYPDYLGKDIAFIVRQKLTGKL